MSSPASALLGWQEPRLRSCPTYRTSAGVEATELAASAGVLLDPWQAASLDDALGEDDAGRWAAFEVALIVSRQNGKGEVLLARELAGLFLFGERLIIHTAHEFKTAAEAFLRIKYVIDNTDDLRRKVKAIRQANGEQGIELLSKYGGGRLRFLARSKGSGRGFTGDLIILDEAYELSASAVGALLPTMSARPNPQLWYASSAGMAESEQLNEVRRRALAGGDPSLAYIEWSAQPGECADLDCDHRPDRVGCWMDNLDAWAQANPAAGRRITAEFIAKERRAMPPGEFARERLTVWSDARTEAVLDVDQWDASADPPLLDVPMSGSQPIGRVVLAVDVPPSRTGAAIGAAGQRADGRTHLELVETRALAGTAARLKELQTRHNPRTIIVDPGSPAGSLIPELDDLGVRYTLVGAREYAQACGALFDAVKIGPHPGGVAHLKQSPLDVAILAARRRVLGDAWAWDRKDGTDISPLAAVTLAKHGLDVALAARRDITANVW